MNNRLKIVAALVIAASVTLPASPASAGTLSGFSDVADDQYFTTPIAWLIESEITKGTEPGCFGPSENVTRGQVAAFLFRLDRALGNSPTAGTNHPFDDVTAAFQIEPVGWMAARGITTGTTPTTFEPDAPIKRGDFATLLWRYAGSPVNNPTHQFSDVTAGYQQEAIRWMAARKITNGTTPTTFDPNGLVSRAQAATFLFRFAEPGPVSVSTDVAGCSRSLRIALLSAGLTLEEATCAVPHLSEFSVELLNRVVSGELTPGTALLDAVATIHANGCLTTERVVELAEMIL